jgi:hypothetical protein
VLAGSKREKSLVNSRTVSVHRSGAGHQERTEDNSVYLEGLLTARRPALRIDIMSDFELVKRAWELLGSDDYGPMHPVKILARGILVHINPDHFAKQFGKSPETVKIETEAKTKRRSIYDPRW